MAESNNTALQMRAPQSVVDREPDPLLEIQSKRARIAVLGMGHVGLPTALSLCELGWQVLGADSALPLLQQLRAGEVPFYEPGMQELV